MSEEVKAANHAWEVVREKNNKNPCEQCEQVDCEGCEYLERRKDENT